MQPSQDQLNTPRRPLDVEDYVDIVRRHRSWIIGPTFAGLVIAVVVAFMWPDSYISEATIRVTPPVVPEKYVATNVNQEISQRISSMYQQVTSVSNLTNLITNNGLYPNERKRKPMLDVCEMMKKDIHVSPASSLPTGGGRTQVTAFRIAFEYPDRRVANKVTADLVKNFMDYNFQERSSRSLGTTAFMDESWNEAKKQLDALETKLTAFRIRYSGRLPEQMQANLQAMRSLETQLSGVNEAIARIGQEKLLFESQIRILKDQMSSLGTVADPIGMAVQNERLTGMEREIAQREAALTTMKERYKETHPDVKSMQAQIAVLKKNRDDALKAELDRKPDPRPRVPNFNEVRSRREFERQIASLQSQVQAKDLELEERIKEQKNLRVAINGYGVRIQSSPALEGEYTKMSRDYDLAKKEYDDLNTKRAQSRLATDLESQKKGELLEVLEDATLPETPAKPNRWLIVGAGLGMGLIAGVFIAGAREMQDTSLKSLKDARAYTNLPVLGTVPLLENDLVVRRKRRLSWLAWSAACILGLLAMTTSIYLYYTSKT
jgi:polysaccharide biosynthesis transport protein